MQLLVRVRRLARARCDQRRWRAPRARHRDGPLLERADPGRRIAIPARSTSRSSRQHPLHSTPPARTRRDRLGALGVSATRLERRDLRDRLQTILTVSIRTALVRASRRYAVDRRRHDARARTAAPSRPSRRGGMARAAAERAGRVRHRDPPGSGAARRALSRLNRRLRDFSAHRMLETERGALGDVHVDIGLDSASAHYASASHAISDVRCISPSSPPCGRIHSMRTGRCERCAARWLCRRAHRRGGHALPPHGGAS